MPCLIGHITLTFLGSFLSVENKQLVTVRKRSCGKAMLLHLSVILFTGGGACVAGGQYMAGGCGGGRVWQEIRPLQWTVHILLECILV